MTDFGDKIEAGFHYPAQIQKILAQIGDNVQFHQIEVKDRSEAGRIPQKSIRIIPATVPIASKPLKAGTELAALLGCI